MISFNFCVCKRYIFWWWIMMLFFSYNTFICLILSFSLFYRGWEGRKGPQQNQPTFMMFIDSVDCFHHSIEEHFLHLSSDFISSSSLILIKKGLIIHILLLFVSFQWWGATEVENVNLLPFSMSTLLAWT